MGEQAPTKEPPTRSETATKEAGWNATYLDGLGRAVKKVLITSAMVKEHDGLTAALTALMPDDAADVGKVVCSACERGHLAFKVTHDPTACAAVHDERNSYAPPKPKGVPRVVPNDKRTRAYRRVRAQLGSV